MIWLPHGPKPTTAILTLSMLVWGTSVWTRSAKCQGVDVATGSGSLPVGRVSFQTDVVPLLTKLGCNSGACHGKATGQNGFRLSLLGFEPDLDYHAIVHESRGRRLFEASPEHSLLLLKATGGVAHGGGVRLPADSDDYQTLSAWIGQGAQPSRIGEPKLDRVTVTPQRYIFAGQQRQQSLQVTAYFSDGSRRDVTQRAVYLANEPELAEVSGSGRVQVGQRSGAFAVMVRYGEQIAVFYGMIPYSHGSSAIQTELEAWERRSAKSFVDQLLVAQWKRLGITPSPPADDREFIRRVTLDICGTLPTSDEVADYVQDADSDKRARLIDRLLSRPEYASFFALKWADILRNRGLGYGTRYQRAGTALFADWIRDCLAANVSYDRFVASILTASGSQEINPPTIWYRSVRTKTDYVESVAQAFLGIRIQCAQCHHHPAENWTQSDYYQLAAVFARVGRKGGYADAEVPTGETIFLADEVEVLHPRTGLRMTPRPPGGDDFQLTRYDDPRRSLANWMTSPENPYFARTMANRMWGHFFGRGIIHPIDDARSTNPPSNPELLDALTRDFAMHGYDVKHLIQVICNSSAYALSSVPNDANRDDSQSFASYYPRRLAAEVLLDAFAQVLDAPTRFRSTAGEFPLGTRAIDLPDEAVPSHFLDVFGRPARNSACECERSDSPALGQTLELVNSSELQAKLTADKGYVAQLAANDHSHVENVDEIFLRLLSRPPRDKERTVAVNFLKSQTNRKSAYASLLWSLVATNEFLFNH